MEIRAYLRILKRRWWVLLICLGITVAASLAFSLSQPAVYGTTTTYIIRPRTATGAQEDFVKTLDMVSRNSEISSTFSEVANSKYIRQAAIMQLALTPEKLKGLTVDAKVIGGTNILELNVQGQDPVVVRDFANVVGSEFVSYIGKLYDVFDLELLDEAGLPKQPVESSLVINLIMGATLGLVLGMGLIFLFEYFQAPAESAGSFNIIDRETGAYNKSYFMLRLWQEMSRAKRNKYPLSLGLIKVEVEEIVDYASSTDLDQIEAMRVVKLFADQSLREEDILARFDQDIYAVLLPDLQGEKAKAIVETLLARINSITLDASDRDGGLKIMGIAGVVSNINTRTPQEQFLKQALSALENPDREADGKVIMLSEKAYIDTIN